MINQQIMIERSQKAQIEKLIKNFPVVGIVGARQVGKTTLVKNLAPILDKRLFRP